MSIMVIFVCSGGRNFSCYTSSIPFGHILLLVESTAKAFRILTKSTLSTFLRRSIKIKDHTRVWPKILCAPAAGFEPATN